MTSYFSLSDNPKYTLNEISHFNNHCFPIRSDHEEYDIYRFVYNPFSSEKKDFIYCVTKDNKYVAQMLTMPAPLSLNEKKIPAFWGQDYYVLEEYRGEGIGKDLSNFYLKKDYYIAVGFSPKSAVIHQKMGAKKVGYLDFYRKWASPFHQIKFLFQRGLGIKPKKITSYRFPEEVNGFERINEVGNLHFPNLNWNKNVIESIRNKAYFQWRFFHKPDRYFVYQFREKKETNPAYFVVKPHFYKGVHWLKVVDYRFSNSNPHEFKSILKSVEKIRKDLNLYGVLVPSSQQISNEILIRNHFERYKHEVVLTTYPFKHENSEQPHNHFIISFADSDLDMHNYLGRFNYGEDY